MYSLTSRTDRNAAHHIVAYADRRAADSAPLSSQYDPMNSVFKMKFGNIVPDTSGDYYGWALASLTAVSFLLDGILVVTIGAATVFSSIAMVETQDTTAVAYSGRK